MVLAILVLGAVAAAIAWLEPSQATLSGNGARASDGDSLRLGAERIRLIGLDAPELDQSCADGQGKAWACGAAARDRLAALLAVGPIACRPDGHDRYGRVLATCTVAERDLGHAMVAEGLAVASGDYVVEELKARAAGLGIWSGPFERPRDWRDRDAPTPWGWLTSLWP